MSQFGKQLLIKNDPSVGMIDDVDKKQGIVSGYASTFNVKDSDNETVVKGAFKKTINDWKSQVEAIGRGRVKMLRNHDVTQLVGVPTELKEDDTGLHYIAKITTKTQLGRDTLALIEDGIITEHSFGYKVFNVAKDEKDETNTFLTELGLFEISYVSYGSNWLTPITDIKSEEGFQKATNEFIKYVHNLRKFMKSGDLENEEMIQQITLFSEQIETKFSSLMELLKEKQTLLDSYKESDVEKDDKNVEDDAGESINITSDNASDDSTQTETENSEATSDEDTEENDGKGTKDAGENLHSDMSDYFTNVLRDGLKEVKLNKDYDEIYQEAKNLEMKNIWKLGE